MSDQTERIDFDMTPQEYSQVMEKKGTKTWRELFLGALGIDTKRKRSGPPRRSEVKS